MHHSSSCGCFILFFCFLILMLVFVWYTFFALQHKEEGESKKQKKNTIRIHLSWCRKFPFTPLFHFFPTYPSFSLRLRLYVYLGGFFFLTQSLSITIWLFADLRLWTRNMFRGFFLHLQITVSCKWFLDSKGRYP